MLPAQQLPPPDPALRQRALAALTLGVLSLLGLALGLGNLRRGMYVAVLTLLFAVTAIWMLLAMIVAVRQALDYRSTARAVGVCVLGWILAIGLAVLLGVLFGPAVS